VNAIAWSPDGTRVATVSQDRTARIWDGPAAPGPPRLPPYSILASCTLSGHQDPATDVAFHPIRPQLFTTSADGTVRVWPLAGGPAEHVLAGHNGAVTGIAFSPGGEFFITSSADGTARIWSSDTWQTVATLIPLGEGGYATLLPGGSYKLRGTPGDRLWWAMKLCRFAPGELDPYVPGIRRLPDDAPILPGHEASG